MTASKPEWELGAIAWSLDYVALWSERASADEDADGLIDEDALLADAPMPEQKGEGTRAAGPLLT